MPVWKQITFYYDPPNKQIEGDPSATWIRYQSVARLTPGGYDTTDLESYDGEWFYYRNSAWNPADQVMYAYKVNYKPGQTWLMAVSVPKMELKPVSRIPDLPRGGGFSPLFAFDTTRGTLIVADAQRPCGSAFVNAWYSYDVHGDTWTKNTLDKYAFTTLNYDGRHAVDGRYWERQHYTVDIATGAVSRQR